METLLQMTKGRVFQMVGAATAKHVQTQGANNNLSQMNAGG